MPHFYRTLAKFRAPKQSEGNHTSCFRVEENCLMAWRWDFFPSGIAHLGCYVMTLRVSCSEVLSTGVLGTMKTTMGSWQIKGKATSSEYLKAGFCWFARGNDPNSLLPGYDQLSWVTQLLPHLWQAAAEGRVPAYLHTHLQRSFLKNISLFSQPRKKVQVDSPLPFSCKPGKRLQLGTAWGVSECWQLQHYWKLYLNEDAAMWKLFLAK